MILTYQINQSTSISLLTSHFQQFVMQRKVCCYFLQLFISRLPHPFVLLDELIVSGSHRQLMESLTQRIYFLSIRVQFDNKLLSLSPHTLLVLVKLFYSFLSLNIDVFNLLHRWSLLVNGMNLTYQSGSTATLHNSKRSGTF